MTRKHCFSNMYFCLAITFSLFVNVKAKSGDIPTGIIETECRERYLAVQVRLNNARSEARFEAVDTTGLHPITKEYGAVCGYSSEFFSEVGIAELRASYFSCHTREQGNEEFTFNFNLITSDQHGEEMTYNVSKTCTLPLPLSPREVICEMDYMEVTIDSAVPYPITGGGVQNQNWDFTFSSVYSLASSAWQLMFLKDGQMSTPLSLSKAHELGYRLHLTPGRVLFRTPHGRPFSFISMVNGVPVEVIHAVLFSRQGWSVAIFDLVAACSADEGSFDGTSLNWQVPAMTFPLPSHAGFVSKNLHIGVNGKLLDPQITVDRGYTLSTGEDEINITIPFGAEGGHRHSFVAHNAYLEMYTIYLYFEGVFMDSVHTESRHWHTKFLMTPLLPRLPFTVNQTILEERVFTVYLGNIPSDVMLAAMTINVHEFPVANATQSGYTIVDVPHANGSHGYVIKVPFEDPIVRKWYFREGVLKYLMNVNFTLNIINQEHYYFHLASFEARIHDVYPPTFSGQCMDHGIFFKLDHKEFDHMWDITIGDHPLTEQFAAEQGYLMVNDSQSVLLDVPLFSPGYVYEGVNLQRFFGSFEILSRDAKTQEIQKYSAKRCPFQTTQIIVCSPRGVMTVVADVIKSVPQAVPLRTTLLDPICKPKETDDTRVLFEFELSKCGTTVKVKGGVMIFENMIVFKPEQIPSVRPVITRDTTFVLAIRCSYPVEDVNMGVSFKSTVHGLGSVGVAKTSVTAMVNPMELFPSEVVNQKPTQFVQLEDRRKI